MRMHASRGARAEVARQYQACVDVLKRELGATPDPETTRLYRELMADASPIVPRSPSAAPD